MHHKLGELGRALSDVSECWTIILIWFCLSLFFLYGSGAFKGGHQKVSFPPKSLGPMRPALLCAHLTSVCWRGHVDDGTLRNA